MNWEPVLEKPRTSTKRGVQVLSLIHIYYSKILSDAALVREIIKKELLQLKEKYIDPRRTQISQTEGDLSSEDLIAEEDAVITITHRGYVKRIPTTSYRVQKRGGRGITGLTLSLIHI